MSALIVSRSFFLCRIFLVLLLILPLTTKAQRRKIDSLEAQLKLAASDTKRIALHVKLVWAYRRFSMDTAMIHAEQALSLAKNSGEARYEADTYDCLGMLNQRKSDFKTALEYYKKFLEAAERSGLKSMQADAHHGIGNCYLYMGQYEPAMQSYMKAVKLNEKTGNKAWMANDYANIGVIQTRQKLYKDAVKTYLIILPIYTELKDSLGMATCLKNIGVCYSEQKNNDEALKYFFRCLELEQRINKADIGGTYNNIADVMMNLGKKDEAGKYYRKALALVENSNDAFSKVYTYRGLGYLSLDKGDVKLGLEYLHKVLDISRESGLNYELMDTYGDLSKAYAKTGDYKKAWEYEVLRTQLKDTVHNQQNSDAIVEMQTKFETEKKEKELELQSAKLKTQDAEIGRQKLISYFIAIMLVLAGAMVFIVLRSNKQKQRINALLEARNRDITDSINYASRIQQVTLPTREMRNEMFPDSMLIFKPKDVVSGDFYWYGERNGQKIVAAVDCTGHGVPGAFMSMMGAAFLNEIINERGITQPAEILNELRNMVIRTMKQTGASGEAKDGMDISLVSINMKDRSAEYAGANNPLWIRRKGSKDHMETIKPEKRSIGYHLGRGLPFTNHRIQYQEGDSFYLFSDGYADQFGGEKGKKFKYKQLELILLKIGDQSMKEQEAVMSMTFEAWKGKLEQVDDVLLIGIRL